MNPVTKRTIAHLVTAGAVAAAVIGCAAPTAGSVSPSAPTGSAASPVSSAEPAPAAGCAGGTTAAAAPVEITARLVGGRVDPSPQRVDVALGAPVVLRVEADTPIDVHVHGYDWQAPAAPGAPACLEFVADVPGVYEVEAHPQHTLILQLAVR